MAERKDKPDGEAKTLVARPKGSMADAASTAPAAHRQIDIAEAGAKIKQQGFAARYKSSTALGEGAMGEVVLTHDKLIGRHVALKRMHAEHRDERPDLRKRFVREARVQGQLEHPSVVPVYDIGIDPDGSPFFTMKRVRGRTLTEIVEGLCRGDEAIVQTYSRRRLLTAMSRICLCAAFAHERGVVHRDLKPSNIMLGEYGEVHVLDWGIAQLSGKQDEPDSQLNIPPDRIHQTQTGFVVGTPGYLAPEQARGERDTYGGRSDIYSLGAMLFELMCLKRLHHQETVEQLLLSTVEGIEARPSVRAADFDLPEELDEICTRATALNPDDRYRSAREMNEAIEGLLDGDRDTSRRAELAEEQLSSAREALQLARRGGAIADGQHRRAVAALLHALALEPDHPEARGMLVELLLEPAEELPQEATEELRAVKFRDRSRAAAMNVAGLAGWWPVIPLAAWMGVRDWSLLSVLSAATVTLLVYFTWMSRTRRVGPEFTLPALLGGFTVIGSMAMFFGPLFVVPGMAVGAAAASIVGLQAEQPGRILINALAQAVVVVPALLMFTGVLPSPYVFTDGQMCIQPGLTELPENATWAFLIVTNVLMIAMGAVLTGRAVEALLVAERRSFAQAWRLKQFLPTMEPESTESASK